MILDPEDSTRLEGRIHALECLIGITTIHPVVKIAERDDEIGGSGRRYLVVTLAGPGDADSAEAILLLGHASPPCRSGLVFFLALTAHGDSRIVVSGVLEIRSQYLRPVTASRPDLHDGHVGFH